VNDIYDFLKDEEEWEKDEIKNTFFLLGTVLAITIPLALVMWYFS